MDIQYKAALTGALLFATCAALACDNCMEIPIVNNSGNHILINYSEVGKCTATKKTNTFTLSTETCENSWAGGTVKIPGNLYWNNYLNITLSDVSTNKKCTFKAGYVSAPQDQKHRHYRMYTVSGDCSGVDGISSGPSPKRTVTITKGW